MTNDVTHNGGTGQNPTASRPQTSCTDCRALATITPDSAADAREAAQNHATATGHAVTLTVDGESETIQFASTITGPEFEHVQTHGGRQ